MDKYPELVPYIKRDVGFSLGVLERYKTLLLDSIKELELKSLFEPKNGVLTEPMDTQSEEFQQFKKIILKSKS